MVRVALERQRAYVAASCKGRLTLAGAWNLLTGSQIDFTQKIKWKRYNPCTSLIKILIWQQTTDAKTKKRKRSHQEISSSCNMKLNCFAFGSLDKNMVILYSFLPTRVKLVKNAFLRIAFIKTETKKLTAHFHFDKLLKFAVTFRWHLEHFTPVVCLF